MIKVERSSGGQWVTKATCSYDTFNRRVVHVQWVGNTIKWDGYLVYKGIDWYHGFDKNDPVTRYLTGSLC